MAVVHDERSALETEAFPPPLPPMPSRPRAHRRRRWVLLGIGVVAVVVLSTFAFGFVRYELRSHPGAKSVGSAVHAFHSGPDVTANGSPYAQPAAGVYTLGGQGHEQISFPPNTQNDGAVMPATVQYLSSGCWRWHIDYNVAHWEEFDFCPTAAGLGQPVNRNSQSWDFGALKISNQATLTCPSTTVVLPPDPRAGTTLHWSCPEVNTVAGSGRSTTTATIVGTGTLQIGGTAVTAVHEQQKTTVTGAQKGAVTEDWWFSTSTGLPLQVQRHIVIHTNSPLGAITYTENGSWTMSSLTPRT